jgi:hypothetical protein
MYAHCSVKSAGIHVDLVRINSLEGGSDLGGCFSIGLHVIQEVLIHCILKITI